MRIAACVFVAVALVVGAALAGSPKFRLRDVAFMSFRAGQRTLSRRLPPMDQMECVMGSAHCALGLQPSWANCTNVGFDGADVVWQCQSDVDPTRAALTDTLVLCEPYADDADAMSLVGSCGLKYELNVTAKPALIDLRHVRELRLVHDKRTRTVAARAGPQAVYVGSFAALVPSMLPETVRCLHAGISPQGVVRWMCEASLNPNIELSSSRVSCESAATAAAALAGEHADVIAAADASAAATAVAAAQSGKPHPMLVVDGSCGVEYNLTVLTREDAGFLLKHREALSFESDVYINSPRRTAPVLQMACRDPCALDPQLRPRAVVCRVRARADGDTIDFACAPAAGSVPKLDAALALGNVSVECEGLYGASDPFKVPNSCLLRYDLVPAAAMRDDGFGYGSPAEPAEPATAVPQCAGADAQCADATADAQLQASLARFSQEPALAAADEPDHPQIAAWTRALSESLANWKPTVDALFSALALEDDESYVALVANAYHELSGSDLLMALTPAVALLALIGCCFLKHGDGAAGRSRRGARRAAPAARAEGHANADAR